MMRFGFADKIAAKILFWRQVVAQRRELGALSDEVLEDIGINRAEATLEAHRHFWDTAPRERKVEKKMPTSQLTLNKA